MHTSRDSFLCFAVGFAVILVLSGCQRSANHVLVHPDVINKKERNVAFSITEQRLVLPLGDNLGAINSFNVSDRHIYVVDIVDRTLKIFTLKGEFVTEVTKGRGNAPGEIFAPVDFTFQNNRILVLDPNPRRISVYNKSGKYLSRFQIPDAALSFAASEKELLLYAPMRPNTFVRIDSSGKMLNSWKNQLSEDVRNPLALSGRLLFIRPSSFVYVPIYHSSWIHYSTDGALVKIVETIDDRSPGETDSNYEANVVRRPDTDISAYSASVSGKVVNLHILDSSNRDTKAAYIDRYDLHTGDYINSIELPAYTSRVQIIDNLIYYSDSSGIMRGRLVPCHA